MWSYTVTATPPAASSSAAIRPAGPPPMMAALRRGLAGLGVPEKQIHYEQFSL